MEEVEPEAGQLLRCFFQEWGIRPVGPCDDELDGQALAFDHQGAFRALSAPINGALSCGFTPTRCFHDAPVHSEVLPLEAEHLVCSLQAQVLEVLEDPGLNPLIPAPPDRGHRTAFIRDPLMGDAPCEDPDECVDDDALTHPGAVASQRVSVHHGWDQAVEPVPDGFEDGRWKMEQRA